MKVISAIAGKWMLVVAFTLLGLVAAMGYSLLQPQTYVATVRTYIATGTSDMLEAYQGNQAARASIQTFAVLATDPTVAQRAIERSGVDISLQEFLPEISVSVPPQTVILDVSVQDASSQDAEKLSTALAQELVGMVTDLQEPTSGGPGALRLVVVDPNTQGAVRQQLIDPMLLAVGAITGALLGTVLALLLQQRGKSGAESRAPNGPGTDEAEVTINRNPDLIVQPATSPKLLVEPATSPNLMVEPATSPNLLVEPATSEARSRVEATPTDRPAAAPYTARHTVSRHSAGRRTGGFAGTARPS
ncbi:capsular biosynthesis protein [Gordonia sp. zg691]|uniref:YveK family protein n=1 Tax=Gordonia jinghuaiqii TaxID=2758710 RepID=UPI0016622D75|nr:capsular biosynthesis protein [Gordonia jinghuaiqii]MBD0864084.1 capsular biosynthesis protein [Gordonia jinghuaiqii]